MPNFLMEFTTITPGTFSIYCVSVKEVKPMSCFRQKGIFLHPAAFPKIT
jgi:hypothetical protein